jgi:HAD superfamily hydrolase (TIGR01509 family)
MEEARAFGRDLPLAVFLTMVGTSDTRSREIERAHFGEAFPIAEYRAALSARARAAFARGVALKPGVVDLLDQLDRARLPRAICTSSSPAAVVSHLGPSGILPRFDFIIANGDYQNGKPHPEPYLTAAGRLGAKPEDCLALEDSHNGVRSAHAAGMMTIMVPDLLEATEEIRALCAGVAESLHDVGALLGGRA